MSQQSSYTSEEINQFHEYLVKRPRAQRWTTSDGIVIPYRFIKFEHLQNILVFIDAYKDHYIRRSSRTQHERLVRSLKKLKEIKLKQMPSAAKILYGDPEKG